MPGCVRKAAEILVRGSQSDSSLIMFVTYKAHISLSEEMPTEADCRLGEYECALK